MIRFLISALIIISSIVLGFSQTHVISSLYEVPATSERMDSLLSAINDREKELEQIKKDKVRADSLDALVDDYALLVNLWQNEYHHVKTHRINTIHWYACYLKVILYLIWNCRIFLLFLLL